jgi:hypothetical protein
VGTLNNGIELDYAFALDIKPYKGLKTVSHGGALGGYKSALLRFSDHNFSVIILSNLSTFNPTLLSYRVADVYLAEFFTEEKEKPTKLQTVELPREKLQNKTGSYIRFESGEKIRVFIKEEKLYITLQNRDYPLAPLSAYEFIVQNIPRRLSIRFERQESGKPSLLQVNEVGQRPRTYVESNRATPNEKQLSEYQGRFYSEELHVTFEVRLEEGKLRFVHRKASPVPFKPLYKDLFQIGSLRVHFVRSEGQEIDGFLLDAGRVKNLRFTKRS